MRVYLAAPYGSRELLRAVIAPAFEAAGLVVTSSWLEQLVPITPGTQGAAAALDDVTVAGHAADDLEDVDASEALVLFTADYVGVGGGGGRHVETGFALAQGKPVVVVGEPENVFHRLGQPRVRVVANHEAAILLLVGDEGRLGGNPVDRRMAGGGGSRP